MFITLEALQKAGACQIALDFLAKHYPEGVDAKYVIEKGHLPDHYLHWAFENLNVDDEDVAAYYKKMYITNSKGVFNSDHISGSLVVQRSSHVSNSQYIYRSEDVECSEYVVGSESVYDSKYVNLSSFVQSSNYVKTSANITDCSNIVDSTYAVMSHQITGSKNVENCYDIRGSKNLQDCACCGECSNSHHLLFCQGITDGEYMMFNKKVSERQFETIRTQYQRFAPLSVVMELQDGTIEAPKTIYSMKDQYSCVPEKFWKWVKTLPSYDPYILYCITFQKDLI